MSNAMEMIYRCAARQDVPEEYQLPGCIASVDTTSIVPTPSIPGTDLGRSDHIPISSEDVYP